uniref:Uncharacterized protein n=1 Tax=Tetranychus urticae TaxID=32264 RepID=T1L0J8_TETUR
MLQIQSSDLELVKKMQHLLGQLIAVEPPEKSTATDE